MFLVGGILDHWDFLRGTEFHQRPGATNKSRGCSTAFLRHPFLACLRVSKKNLLSLHKIRLHELGPDDSVWPQLSKLPNFGSFSLRVSFVRLWFPDLDVVGFHVVVSVESTHVFSWVTCCQLPPTKKKMPLKWEWTFWLSGSDQSTRSKRYIGHPVEFLSRLFSFEAGEKSQTKRRCFLLVY